MTLNKRKVTSRMEKKFKLSQINKHATKNQCQVEADQLNDFSVQPEKILLVLHVTFL